MGYFPLPVHGIAVESALQMIMESTPGHGIQGPDHHLLGGFAIRMGVKMEKQQQRVVGRELHSLTETAPVLIKRAQDPQGQTVPLHPSGWARSRVHGEPLHLFTVLRVPLSRPLQYLQECGHPSFPGGGKVGGPEKGMTLRR